MAKCFGRKIIINHNTPGIITQYIQKQLQSDKRLSSLYADKFKGYNVIMGIDKLGTLSGIGVKLTTFEAFLAKVPNPEKWKLYQICFSDTYFPKKHDALKESIISHAEKINSKYSKAVELRFESLSMCEILNILKEAKCFLITSFRTNFQIFAFIYVYLCGYLERNKYIIASEFTGIPKTLTTAIIINPYNIEKTVKILIEISEDNGFENMDKIKCDYEQIGNNDVIKWGGELIHDVIKVQKRVFY